MLFVGISTFKLHATVILVVFSAIRVIRWLVVDLSLGLELGRASGTTGHVVVSGHAVVDIK